MGLWQDIQFAARLLVKDKWFTLVAAGALALGIGVNATVFTFVNAVLIRGLPFEDGDRIYAITSRDPIRDRNMGVSYLDYKDYAASAKSFTTMAAYTGIIANLSDEGRPPERFFGTYVSANTFALIGQRPIMGRDFLPEDDRPGAAAVIMLGSGVWKNRYGSDPAVVGRTIRVNDVPSVVIGVMPEDFKFPFNADVWQPLSTIRDLEEQKRNARGLEVMGRLSPTASPSQAEAELATIGQRLTKDYPDTNKNVVPRLQTFNQRVTGGPIRPMFFSLMGAVAFVLLIACANVANLLLARSAYRSREVAVRISLGATRWRVIRQLLIESLMLAVISGLLGLALSTIGIRWFDAETQDAGKPYWMMFTMDARVFGYLAAICLGTGIIFGLAPALHVSKTDINEVLKEGGRSGSSGVRAHRWTSSLIVVEIALTLALLAGAGFMMRNFFTLYRSDIGVDTSRLVAMSLVLPERKYPALEQRLAFYRQLQDRLQSNRNIQAVSVTSNLPSLGGTQRQLLIDGRPLASGEQAPMVTMLTVDPRYFETVRLAILRGRGFTDVDGSAGRESAIVNTRFVQMFFPKEDPIGRRIVLNMDLAGGAPPSGGIPTSLTATIVGIVPNVRQRNFNEPETDPVAYLPYRTDPRGFMNLLARTDGDPAAVTSLIREELRQVDADLPLFNIRTMDDNLARQRWPFRVFGIMFGAFAFIALVLSAVGLYAVTAYSVTQRTQEIGVRTALGAAPTNVMWLFMRRALVHLGIGLTIGMAAALGVGKIFESTQLLVRMNGRDPITIASIATVLAIVAITASIVPARKATQLDPLVALRGE
jgi:predicted permease